ncbi:MAG: hypothetical protein KDD20_12230 [Mangrovimonas sp.]|nr:hypothetical protein [Mangrovimonas sp.]
MKKIFSLVLVLVLVFSCDSNDTKEYEYYNVAKPILMSKAELRTSVEILGPQSILNQGKIYYYNNYIFINDENAGVHVIDNTNPSAPQAIAYIKIPGNEDISIKNNYLFADSAVDLVVFDISNINVIQEVSRLEDVFNVYDYNIPTDVDIVEYGDFNYNENIIVGWDVTLERREVNQDDIILWDGATNESGGDTVGVGGSLARFQIVDTYLYTVGENELDIFDITNLSNPSHTGNMYAGWNIETLFYADDYLYLGGTNGMFIYDIHDRTQPLYTSEFTHWEGCDPVVVDGNYAYLTLRGGNLCGQEESILEVIDVSDKTSPVLVGQYTMENPYGLGIKDNALFVCDGTAGLKIFDKSNPLELQMIENFANVQGKDVIPLEDVLLLISEDYLYQYEYNGNSVNLISAYQF